MIGRMNRFVCAIGAVTAMACPATAQTIITQWTFNSNPPDGNTATGTFAPAVGLGAASCYNVLPAQPLVECIFANGAGSTDPGADNSGWQTRGYQNQGENPGLVGVEFAVDTSNFTGIIVSWDQRHSNTSSRWVNLFYSVDGVNFVEAPSAPFEGNAGDTWFNDRTVDLSSISAANNNPNFKFRISPVFAPSTSQYVAANSSSTYASTGTHRFDMVTVRGTAVGSIPPTVVATATPGAVCAAGGQVTLSATVIPGLLPDSTGLAVSANLTDIGGGAAVALLDDGLNGDEFAGDNIFTLQYTVPAGVSVGSKTIPVTVTDAQSRSNSTNVSFAVADCSVNSASRVVISQVYGGGGNLGPPAGAFNADFVEIYNRSAMPVDLTGWSVQYASQASVNGFNNLADRVELFGTIQPGQYMLVQFSAIGARARAADARLRRDRRHGQQRREGRGWFAAPRRSAPTATMRTLGTSPRTARPSASRQRLRAHRERHRRGASSAARGHRPELPRLCDRHALAAEPSDRRVPGRISVGAARGRVRWRERDLHGQRVRRDHAPEHGPPSPRRPVVDRRRGEPIADRKRRRRVDADLRDPRQREPGRETRPHHVERCAVSFRFVIGRAPRSDVQRLGFAHRCERVLRRRRQRRRAV